MEAFEFYNPTKIYFGEGALDRLAEAAAPYQRILLCYGGGSIKKNGIYEKVLKALGTKIVAEVPGIMPNPRTEKVYEGQARCQEEQVDLVLAVGGGSVIDCAKAIALAAKSEEDFWQKYFLRRDPVEACLPVASVLTLAGTGSEFNGSTVISKWDEDLKYGFGSPRLMPVFSILDPSFTYSLPKEQMVAGAIDTLSHLFEQYFSAPEEPNVSDDLAEALMLSEIENLKVALKNPLDKNARSNMMWTSSLALNTLVSRGKETDWMSHQIEHALSAFYDVTHGLGLAVVHPVYLSTVVDKAPARFARFAKRIMGVPVSFGTELERGQEGLRRLRAFFRSCGAPITLQELGIPAERIPEIAKKTKRFDTSYTDLDDAGIERILRLCCKETLFEE